MLNSIIRYIPLGLVLWFLSSAQGQSVYLDDYISDADPPTTALHKLIADERIFEIIFTPGTTYEIGTTYLRSNLKLNINGAEIKKFNKFVFRFDTRVELDTRWVDENGNYKLDGVPVPQEDHIRRVKIIDGDWDWNETPREFHSMINMRNGPISDVVISGNNVRNSGETPSRNQGRDSWWCTINPRIGDVSRLIFENNHTDAEGYVLVTGGFRTGLIDCIFRNNTMRGGWNGDFGPPGHQSANTGAFYENVKFVGNTIYDSESGFNLGLDGGWDGESLREFNINGLQVTDNLVVMSRDFRPDGTPVPPRTRVGIRIRFGSAGEQRNIIVQGNQVDRGDSQHTIYDLSFIQQWTSGMPKPVEIKGFTVTGNKTQTIRFFSMERSSVVNSERLVGDNIVETVQFANEPQAPAPPDMGLPLNIGSLPGGGKLFWCDNCKCYHVRRE